MSFAVDFPDMFRQSARLIDKIFRGAKPSDIPVEQVTKFKLVINLKTAKTFGLILPDRLLALAGQHADGHSVVRASVFDLGEDHCLLTLVHDALSPQQAPGYAGGWHFHLDSLGRLLAESGAARRRWRELAEHYRTAMGDPS